MFCLFQWDAFNITINSSLVSTLNCLLEQHFPVVWLVAKVNSVKMMLRSFHIYCWAVASYTCSQINSEGLLCSTELFPANQNCSHSHAVDRPSCLLVPWWIFPMSHTLHPGVPLCLTVCSNTVNLHRTLSSKRLICVLTHTSSLSVTHTRTHENTQFASLMFKEGGKLKEISTASERVNLG